MTVKRAHMITRAYLAGWASGRDQVHVWDAESRVEGPRSLNAATVVNHAYRTEHLTVDLESDYARIESGAMPAIRNLAQGGSLTDAGRGAVVEFLDMFLERGRFADQAKLTAPVATANIRKAGVEVKQFGLGDRMSLSRAVNDAAVTLSSLRVDRWRWSVVSVESGLITGDGAAVLWDSGDGSSVTAVTFPLSRTRLLVIGDSLIGRTIPVNAAIASRSRRWLVDHVDGEVARALRFS